MKKLVFIAMLLLLFPANALATAYYFDLASGDDSTGDGSNSNPWKTIDKCTTSRSAGDECRGARDHHRYSLWDTDLHQWEYDR